MKYLSGKEAMIAESYLDAASNIALGSSCLRSRCGTVIVKDDEIIGKGFNSPPGNKTIDHCFKDELPVDFKSDRTCCVHAEQRAIMDALARNAGKITGSRLYFIRLDKDGNQLAAGEPYCTICSKMTLDAGVADFVLRQEKGIAVYSAKEYNKRSFGR